MCLLISESLISCVCAYVSTNLQFGVCVCACACAFACACECVYIHSYVHAGVYLPVCLLDENSLK